MGYVDSLGDSIWKETRIVVLDFISPNRSVVYLDLGCNNGDLTRIIGDKLQASEVHGADVIKELLFDCEKRGIRVHSCDFNRALPFEDNSFDVITANQVWEHLSETDLFTQEIYRILKPGGYAIIASPNLAAWHNIFSLLLGWQPPTAHLSDKAYIGNPFGRQPEFADAELKPIFHRRIPTYKGMIDLFKFYGFSIGGIRGAGYTPFTIGRLSRIFAKIDCRHASTLVIKVFKPK